MSRTRLKEKPVCWVGLQMIPRNQETCGGGLSPSSPWRLPPALSTGWTVTGITRSQRVHRTPAKMVPPGPGRGQTHLPLSKEELEEATPAEMQPEPCLDVLLGKFCQRQESSLSPRRPAQRRPWMYECILNE